MAAQQGSLPRPAFFFVSPFHSFPSLSSHIARLHHLASTLDSTHSASPRLTSLCASVAPHNLKTRVRPDAMRSAETRGIVNLKSVSVAIVTSARVRAAATFRRISSSRYREAL